MYETVKKNDNLYDQILAKRSKGSLGSRARQALKEGGILEYCHQIKKARVRRPGKGGAIVLG